MSGWEAVLRGGRVIDPESGLDAVRDVAIAGGQVTEIGTGLGPARAEFHVAGQVVTAGFVDLHSHVTDIGGMWLQALDGVTTALELEAGAVPVAAAYRRVAEQGRPVNYGFATSWAAARMQGNVLPRAAAAYQGRRAAQPAGGSGQMQSRSGPAAAGPGARMRRKGRLQAGSDADLVVFDPGTVTDRASCRASTRPSAGIRHVLVNGTFVVRDGEIVPGARPGRAVRAEPR